MATMKLLTSLPIAATMDLQYRLPPFQQIFFTPTIIVSVVLLGIALVVVIYFAHRARIKAKLESRREALRMVERILLKRGGTIEDVDRMLNVFRANPKLDPAAIVMIREKFHDELRPVLERMFDQKFGDRMELIYFPPPKDTRRGISAPPADLREKVEEQKTTQSSQAVAAILDLMDATLRPGVIVRMTFEGLEGGHQCLVMGHDMQGFNITLPANNDQLIASIHAGSTADGTLESGPSLLAFSAKVIQAVAGSMPYCRLSLWKTAWEVRKRDSSRLPISLDIDFQHISTSSAESIRVSNLNKEIGTIRPGRLVDLSLGGCGIETPSNATFAVGDMVRFSKVLVASSAPATLLGSIVNIDNIDPDTHEGCVRRLHIQFLVIDDVSQRILVRTLRQLQDVAEREEWLQAQQLLQKMRRNNIKSIGSPGAAARKESTRIYSAANRPTAAPGRTGTRPASNRISSAAKPGVKPSTRSLPKLPPRQSSRPSAKPPPKTPPGA